MKLTIALFMFTLILHGGCTPKNKESSLLHVGFPESWGPLEPTKQNTVYGDMIIFNQFEPLVSASKHGAIQPLAAKSYSVSDDFSKIIFQIDTSRRFSDGSYLTPADVKRSWEHGLSEAKTAANHSVLDAIYMVKGYENFTKSGRLEGLIAKENTLTIEFSRPYRLGLKYLSGARYAVFKIVDGKTIGTGPYVIDRYDQKTVNMSRNPYFRNDTESFKEILITAFEDKNLKKKAILDGQVDAFLFGPRLDEGCKNENIRCVYGMETSHLHLTVNGQPNQFFSNRQHRQALLALLYDGRDSPEFIEMFNNLAASIDFQVYLPAQAGRLDDSDVDEMIKGYRKHIPNFLKETSKNPISFFSTIDNHPIHDFLSAKGVKLTEASSKGIKFDLLLEKLYRNTKFDLLYASSSVLNSDPDGIYHFLGKNGSIMSPANQRESVTALLEKGRNLVSLDQLDSHYRKVTRSVISDVPIVHLGFKYSRVIYRSDKVRYAEVVKKHDDDRLTVFQPL